MAAKKRFPGRFPIVLAALLFLSAALAGGAPGETLKIGGSGAAIGGIARVAKAFRGEHPEVEVIIANPGGSAGAIRPALGGNLDIALSARPLSPEERALGGLETPYARTPFVFAAHRGVPASGITRSEAAAIFLGTMERWKDGTPARPVLRRLPNTDLPALEEISPELGKAYEDAHRREGMIIVRTARECADRIGKTPGAIGVTTLSLAISEERAIKVLAFAGAKPSADAVRDGSYPYTKTFRLVTGPSRSEAVAKFQRFLFSPRAMAILAAAGHMELP